MNDAITAWLRTVVPGLWSAAVAATLTWLGTHAPWAIDLLDLLGIDPTSPAVVAFVVTVVLAGWYALWRRLEPRLPAWATRLTLGSNKTPAYAPVSTDGVADITSLTADERAVVNDLRAIEGRNPLRDDAP